MSSRSLNVAYVCNDLGIPVFGPAGSSVHLRSLLDHLDDLGIELTAYYQSGDDRHPENNILWRQINQYPTQQSGFSQFTGFSDLLKNIGLWRTLSAEGGHHELIHERYSLHSLAGQRYALKRGIPHVLEINAPLVHERTLTGDLTWKRAAERTERRITSNATRIIVVSDRLKEYYSDYVDQDRIHVIPNGVDTDKFNPDRFTSGRDGRFTLGFVGSFKEWHGVEHIIDAAAKLRDLKDEIQFVLVGDGPLLKDLQRETERHNIEDMVLFEGAVPHERVPEQLSRFDVGLAPYPDLSVFYYSPLKIFEYMSMGKPTIASDLGQVGRVLEKGKTGFLVPPDDLNAFVQCIRRVYDIYRDNSEKFSEICRRSRELAVSDYSWERNAERVAEVYERALDGN